MDLETKSWATSPPELERFECINEQTEVYIKSQDHTEKY